MNRTEEANAIVDRIEKAKHEWCLEIYNPQMIDKWKRFQDASLLIERLNKANFQITKAIKERAIKESERKNEKFSFECPRSRTLHYSENSTIYLLSIEQYLSGDHKCEECNTQLEPYK